MRGRGRVGVTPLCVLGSMCGWVTTHVLGRKWLGERARPGQSTTGSALLQGATCLALGSRGRRALHATPAICLSFLSYALFPACSRLPAAHLPTSTVGTSHPAPSALPVLARAGQVVVQEGHPQHFCIFIAKGLVDVFSSCTSSGAGGLGGAEGVNGGTAAAEEADGTSGTIVRHNKGAQLLAAAPSCPDSCLLGACCCTLAWVPTPLRTWPCKPTLLLGVAVTAALPCTYITRKMSSCCQHCKRRLCHALHAGEEQLLDTLGAGDYLGESALLPVPEVSVQIALLAWMQLARPLALRGWA